LGKYFELGDNIDLQGGGSDNTANDWSSIGTNAKPFRGTFDGGNFKIANMSTSSATNNAGFFGNTTNGATIINVKMEKTRVASSGSTVELGTLVGYAVETKIKNCHVAECEVTRTGYAGIVGGLIGKTVQSEIDDCSVTGFTVDPVGGGFVGDASGKTVIKNSSSSGKIYAPNGVGIFGGFAGRVVDVEIIKCFSEAEISGTNNIGGFIGTIEMGDDVTTIVNCYSICTLLGTYHVGGFIGSVINSESVQGDLTLTITGCRASGSAIGQRGDTGGFIGVFRGNGEIIDCIAEVHIIGTDTHVGGFIGITESSESNDVIRITGCRSHGNIENSGNYVGGFVGRANSGDFSDCYSWGRVKGNLYVGGFAGMFSSNATDCFAVATVEGHERVGGFAGEVHNGTVTDCYSVGTVKGNDFVGGFAGVNVYNGSLTNCFSAVTVFCKNRGGGFHPAVTPDPVLGKFINCYFDRQTVEIAEAPNLEGIEALFTSRLTNGVLPGFNDDDDKWVFTSGYYPRLKAFADEDVDAVTRLRSALSVVPIKLAESETVGNVREIFSVADKTPTDDDILWFADPDEMVKVVNNAVYAFASEEWRTLTLRSGRVERSVIFRPTRNLITTDVNIKVNNQPINKIPEQFIHEIPCGSEEGSVFVEIVTGGYVTYDPPVTAMTLLANQPQSVKVTTADGQPPVTYTFIAKKDLPSDIFMQRWDDVLAINNNFATNGGHIFTEYKWYRDNTELPSTKGYIHEPGGLKPPPIKYWAELTSQYGTISTCPAEIDVVQTKSAVYPNPVGRGQAVRVEMGTGRDAARHVSTTDAVMQLFDTTGNIIAKQNLSVPVSEITMPDTPGAYILQVTINGKVERFKIVVE
jgi:hypothetical protein